MSSFGNTTTTNNTTTGTSSQMQQATPQDTAFMNSLYPQMNNLLALSQKPVYGGAQQAQMQNTANQGANSGMQGLASALAARTGNVNSGAFASGAEKLLQQRAGTMSNYAMQTPLLNQEARMSNGLQAMGMANSLAGPALRGSTGTQNGTSNTVQNQSTGWGSMLMSGLGAVSGLASGGGLMGLAGGLFGGGNKGAAPSFGGGGGFGDVSNGDFEGMGGFGGY